MRNTDLSGGVTYSGAKRANSRLKQHAKSSIGMRIRLSYCSLRGWNQSRRLLRLSLRRKERASGEKPGKTLIACGQAISWAMRFYFVSGGYVTHRQDRGKALSSAFWLFFALSALAGA